MNFCATILMESSRLTISIYTLWSYIIMVLQFLHVNVIVVTCKNLWRACKIKSETHYTLEKATRMTPRHLSSPRIQLAIVVSINYCFKYNKESYAHPSTSVKDMFKIRMEQKEESSNSKRTFSWKCMEKKTILKNIKHNCL